MPVVARRLALGLGLHAAGVPRAYSTEADRMRAAEALVAAIDALADPDDVQLAYNMMSVMGDRWPRIPASAALPLVTGRFVGAFRAERRKRLPDIIRLWADRLSAEDLWAERDHVQRPAARAADQADWAADRDVLNGWLYPRIKTISAARREELLARQIQPLAESSWARERIRGRLVPTPEALSAALSLVERKYVWPIYEGRVLLAAVSMHQAFDRTLSWERQEEIMNEIILPDIAAAWPQALELMALNWAEHLTLDQLITERDYEASPLAARVAPVRAEAARATRAMGEAAFDQVLLHYRRELEALEARARANAPRAQRETFGIIQDENGRRIFAVPIPGAAPSPNSSPQRLP
jgi:hypothetical protein